MAIKALMLRQKIDRKKVDLEALRTIEAGYVTREAELEKAITEAKTDEEQAAVEAEVEKFTTDRAANAEKIADLEKEIGELETDLAAEEARQDTNPVNVPEEKREVNTMHETRGRFGLTAEIVNEERAQAFLGEIRTAIKEKRNLDGVGLLIPDTFMGLIREHVVDYSKLLKHVYSRRIKGEGKQVIMGHIPEAVWTACCANINQMDLSFNEATVDCNKVAAIIPVCNATIEDTDINLAAEIIEAILISISKAIDKAIIFGTGIGMPQGIYTRIAETSKPADYPVNGRPWVDLHETNLLKIGAGVTGVALFQTILLDSTVMNGKYSTKEAVWVMNETTLKYLKAQGMSINAAGQIVSAVEGSMPAVGGSVELIEDMPNYIVIGGHFDNYLLSERGPITIESFPGVRVYEDETIFRGKGRYDGLPVIAEAFIGLALNGADFSAPEFAADVANTPAYVLVDKSAVELATTTGTAQIKTRILNATGQEVKDVAITYTSSDTTKATVSDSGKITGKAAGSAVITVAAGEAVAVVNVTIPS